MEGLAPSLWVEDSSSSSLHTSILLLLPGGIHPPSG